MCDTCGCGQPNKAVTIRKPGEKGHSHPHHHENNHDHNHSHDHSHGRTVVVETDILAKNNLIAERNRSYFEAKNIFALNLVSSPGSGKTTILEKTIAKIKNKVICAVVEGDQQTMNDAERIDATGAAVVQVNTGTGCHLDSEMINQASKKLDLQNDSILFIENVGNLVCPALFDLGEAHKIVIISVTEGDDKPHKYPTMFSVSDLCIINKTDLLPYVDFDVEKCKEYARQVNPRIEFIELSATKGEGMEEWTNWLLDKVQKS
ncbi:hydrogenase nickel incorporation protein HypB [bacterium]|nr:hydrogenase nickel incorporation protein HypB [bacterium]